MTDAYHDLTNEEPKDATTTSWFTKTIQSVQNAWFKSAADAGCLNTPVQEEGDELYTAGPMDRSLKLLSGTSIPIIGLGVYRSKPGSETYNAVVSALRAGYRHIDSAQYYRNEMDVGKAIRNSKIPREQVFVTTKLCCDDWGLATAKKSIEASVDRLGLGYIDLMLLHAPGDPTTRAETWVAMEECQQLGLVKSIGVSNFGIAHLEKLLSTAVIPPAVNQIELHPWLQRRELVGYCRSKGIVVEAYSPLAKAHKLQDPTVVAVAKRCGASSSAQVLIKWSLNKGFVALPKSVHPERILENLEAVKVELSEEDMEVLDGLEEGLVTGWDPITQHEV